MPKPFDDLRETLLRAGIAPRHVRAYIAELREHLADLTEQERQAGRDADASIRARALLGDDETLAAAMIARPGMRSLASRAPWLVFMVAPLFSMLFIAIFWGAVFIIIGGADGLLKHANKTPWPEWYSLLVQVMSSTVDLLLMPAIAMVFVFVARRQRMALIWPALVTLLMLIVLVHMGTTTFLIREHGAPVFGVRWYGPFESIELAWTTIFNANAWPLIAAQWPLVLTQWTLTVLPLAWLLRMSKTAQALD